MASSRQQAGTSRVHAPSGALINPLHRPPRTRDRGPDMADTHVCQPSPLLRPIPVYGQREAHSKLVSSFPFQPWKPTDGSLGLGGAHPMTAFMAVHNHLKQQQENLGYALGIRPVVCSPVDKSRNDRIGRQHPDAVSDKLSLCVGPASPYPYALQPLMLPNRGQILPQINVNRKLFPCPECRYTTDRRNNLKRHMLTMHRRCSKLMECCGVLFTTKASLREHSMIFHYHGYTCFYCGRRFCRKALLKRHLSVHNGQKDFVCPVCDYATSHKSNLERHRKIHVRSDDAPSPVPEGEESEDKNHGDMAEETGTDGSAMLSDSSDDEEIDVS